MTNGTAVAQRQTESSTVRMRRPARPARYHLVTGGAGFLGSNLVDRLASEGKTVMVLDRLSRPGVRTNLEWLQARHGERILPLIADIRDEAAVTEAVKGAKAIFHFAAQVAVTTSIADPHEDFGINLQGTFNLLEACRKRAEKPPLLFASTNKVYGKIGDLPIREVGGSYGPNDPIVARFGVGEDRPLEFWSPYGCSKGAADQYVLDYSRIYGLPAAVFRMSCLYGPRQFGTEDQGWVAHFLISSLSGQEITIFGDGRQVRDILFVDDVVDAYLAGMAAIARTSGRAFNIGGGPANAISLLQLLKTLERLHGHRPATAFEDWRPGDQRFYVSDIRAFETATGWRPRTGAWEGIARLDFWLRSNWTDIAAIRSGLAHENSPGESELDLSRQHLFRMPRTAPAAGIGLCESPAGEERPRGSAV